MSRRPVRVLVVDDDRAVADLHLRFLDAHPGFEAIGAAGTGPDALRAMRDERPDLVLLDVHLPGMSGLDALREVRAASGWQPEVIAVTAARDLTSVRLARLAGVRHYLVKPFTSSELRDRLDDVLRERDELDGSGGHTLGQTEIDALLTPPRRSAPLPKGLSAETLGAASRALSTAPGSSAAELGERMGLSRVSSRRYLEHLVATGRAERTLDHSSSGRPVTRYVPRRGA